MLNKLKIVGVVAVLSLLVSSAAHAHGYRGYGGYGYGHGGYVGARYYGPRVVVAPPRVYVAPRPVFRFVPRVPFGAVRVYVGPQPYYYSSGTFYSPVTNGYNVVSAPYGALVTVLPQGATSLVINGVNYATFGGVYYQWDGMRNGWVVVAPPM